MNSEAVVVFIIAVVALFVSLFPHNLENKGFIFRIGIFVVVMASLYMIRRIIPNAVWILLFYRRVRLSDVCLTIRDESTGAFKGEQLVAIIRKLAQEGRATLYGTPPSSNKMVRIPARHFEDHDFFWHESFLLIRTVNPETSWTAEGKDDGFLDLYAEISLLGLLRSQLSELKRSPSPKPVESDAK
jgi:hypothetical protein